MNVDLPRLELDDMRQARRRLAPFVRRTPTIPLSGLMLNGLLGPDAQLWAKLELFQLTGTFKARGALNVALQLTADQKVRGVTAVSAGNHAIAAAYAAAAVGASAKIVVQASANPARMAAARSFGAELVVKPDGPSAFAEVDRIVAEEGRTFIHPFEGLATSLGTAMIGLELVEDVPDLDAVVVAVGGGGLAGGLAAAIKNLLPGCKVFGVEPIGANAMRRSFDIGEPARLAQVQTIADSLAPPMTLPVAYGLCRRYLDDIVCVDDDAICHAMAVMFSDAKLAVEPAGAAALAALLGPLKAPLQGKRVGLIVCGANIDRDTFARYLERGSEPRS